MLQIKEQYDKYGLARIEDDEGYFQMSIHISENWNTLTIRGFDILIPTDNLLDVLDWLFDSSNERRLVVHDERFGSDGIFRRLPSAVEGMFGVIEISRLSSYESATFILSDDDAKVLRESLTEAVCREVELSKKRWCKDHPKKESVSPSPSVFDF